MKPATNWFAGRSSSTRGEPTCSSLPTLLTATRSAIVIASTWSCVTQIIVAPRRWCNRAISARVYTRSLASRFERGSSIKKTAGLRTMARPNGARRHARATLRLIFEGPLLDGQTSHVRPANSCPLSNKESVRRIIHGGKKPPHRLRPTQSLQRGPDHHTRHTKEPMPGCVACPS